MAIYTYEGVKRNGENIKGTVNLPSENEVRIFLRQQGIRPSKIEAQGMLSKEVREKIHGHVEVRAVFKVSRLGNIAGCFVTDGHVVRTDKVRLIRDGKVITEDLTIDTLRRVKDDVKEVKAGLECGIKLANYDDIKIGDRLEAYIRETFERTL